MGGLEFLLPLFASILSGAVGHGLKAREETKRRNEEIQMAQDRRAALQPIIDQLTAGGDWFNREEALVRDFSRASDQMAAQAAQSGMTNAGTGGLDNVRRDVLGSMIAQLAMEKQQDELQRQNMIAQLLNDPSLYVGNLEPGNVGANTFWGGLLGGLAGADTNLSSYLSTKEGLDFLSGQFNRKAAAPVASDPQFSVGNALRQNTVGSQAQAPFSVGVRNSWSLPSYYASPLPPLGFGG